MLDFATCAVGGFVQVVLRVAASDYYIRFGYAASLCQMSSEVVHNGYIMLMYVVVR